MITADAWFKQRIRCISQILVSIQEILEIFKKGIQDFNIMEINKKSWEMLKLC